MHQKKLIPICFLFLLSGCAADITMIDRATGERYKGSTGGTFGGTGEGEINIDGELYSGPWIFQPNGGSFSFSNFNSFSNYGANAYGSGGSAVVNGIGTSQGTSSSYSLSTVGNGMMNFRSPSGKTLRCIFTFNTMQNTGMGVALLSDDRIFDVYLNR